MVKPVSVLPETVAPAHAAAGVDVFDLSRDYGEGPANRAIDELRLAWADVMENDGAKWSMGQSLRFILATCGTFWIAAAVLFYAVH